MEIDRAYQEYLDSLDEQYAEEYEENYDEDDEQGFGLCKCTSVSATPVNWVMDRILGKF